MRILAACFWTVFINGAVIFSIKEGTRRTLEHKIIIIINAQVLFHKRTRLHEHSLSDALNIVGIKDGTGRLATVRAGKAVNFLKYFVVQFMYRFIKPSGLALL